MNKEIKFLIMDVDGTLTDGKIYMGSNGEICKAFNIKDGYGISNLLIPKKIIPIIITGRKSKILENRCKELGITELYQQVGNKLLKLDEILENFSSNLLKADSRSAYTYRNCAYIGDDINDLPCMKMIKKANGVVGCPADAVKEVIEISDYVSKRKGGDGVVRGFIEWILYDKSY